MDLNSNYDQFMISPEYDDDMYDDLLENSESSEYGSAEGESYEYGMDDEDLANDILYRIDPSLLTQNNDLQMVMAHNKKMIARPVLFDDNIAADQIGDEPSSSGVWFMISIGVIVAVVAVLFVLYLAFKQRYQHLRDEMDEKRQATIANQRARMAQMKQQMEAGNLIDAEALVFDSSEKPSSTSSPFFDNSGRRDDFTM